MALHAIMGTCVLALVSGLRIPLASDQFKWNIAMEATPSPQPQVDPLPENTPKPKPKPAQPKAQVMKAQPPPRQPVIEPLQEKVVQTVPPMVQRQTTQTLQPASQVTTVNHTASIVTQAVQHNENTKVFAPTTTRETMVQEEQMVAAQAAVVQESAVPVVTESRISDQPAEPVIQRAAIETIKEPVAEIQQPVSRSNSETPIERPVTESSSQLATTHPQQATVDQPVAHVALTKSIPATKADYGWLVNALLGRVDQLKNYPLMARINHWEGKVVLRAVIRDDGQVLVVDVHESSGRSILDNDAIETLRKASPLKLEHPLGKPQVAILMPISYSLR